MEKKIEVITKEGKIVRVMPHMMGDMAKFDVTQSKRVIKDMPKELTMVTKAVIKPEIKPEITQLPEMKSTITDAPAEMAFEKPKRKPPVRSKK
jgi:hypothetical protein